MPMASMPPPAETAPAPPRSTTSLVLALIGAGLQGLVLVMTVLMGLQWGGWTYLVALAQAVVLTIVAVALAVRWRWVAILVPLVSGALSAGLFAVGYTTETAAACSQEELAAVETLEHLPGTAVTFQGEVVNGCIARFSTDVPPAEVIAHYREQFTQDQWVITVEDATVVVAESKGIVVNVEAPEGEGGLVIIGVADETR